MTIFRFPRLPVATVVLVLIAVPAIAAAADAASVELPADPPAQRTVTLEEVWRLGGEEDEDVLLGLISGGVLDTDGNVLLVDRQLSQVLVVSPDGEVVDTLGREGDGPGETRNPHSIFVTDDRIGLVQGFPAKVVFLDREGAPAGEMRIGGEAAEGGFHFTRFVKWNGEVFVTQAGRGTFDVESGKSSTRTALSVMDLEGNLLVDLVEHQEERDLQRVSFDEAGAWAEYASWALSRQNTVCTVAERDAWALNIRDLEGNLLRTLRRPFTTRKRNQEDKDELVSGMNIVINGRRQEIENYALDNDPAVTDLQYADDGRLFVTTCWNADARLDEGVAGRFDVISPAGEYLEELTLTFPGIDADQDEVIFLDGTRFLVIRNYEGASSAMFAPPGEEPEEPLDAEPLEVVFVRMPG